MTIQATKGMDTRALRYHGETKTLDATWEEGERVFVYNNEKGETLQGNLVAKTDGATVTLLKVN